MAEGGVALPKFGGWDENNPASAEGFTVIFNKARNEKRTGGKFDSRPTSTVQLWERLTLRNGFAACSQLQQNRERRRAFVSCDRTGFTHDFLKARPSIRFLKTGITSYLIYFFIFSFY